MTTHLQDAYAASAADAVSDTNDTNETDNPIDAKKAAAWFKVFVRVATFVLAPAAMTFTGVWLNYGLGTAFIVAAAILSAPVVIMFLALAVVIVLTLLMDD